MRTFVAASALALLAGCASAPIQPHPAPVAPAATNGCGSYLPPVLTYDEFRQQYHPTAVANGFHGGLLSGIMAMRNDEYPAAYGDYLNRNQALIAMHAAQEQCLQQGQKSAQ
jgi:hypothetical protein